MTLGRMNRWHADITRMTVEEEARTGTLVQYTPGHRCSCVTHGDAKVGCRVCDGYGWYWVEAEERPIRAILMDGQVERQLAALGLVNRGDLAIVIRNRRVAYKPEDRIRLNPGHLRTFDIPAESEVVTRRASGDTDTLAQRNNKIIAVEQADPLRGTVATWTEGQDFDAPAQTNQIVWRAGLGPAPQTTYTATYMADYDWVMKQPTVTAAAGSAGFQRRMVLTRRQRDQRAAQDLTRDPHQGGVF
jgi:hypothetical protein